MRADESSVYVVTAAAEPLSVEQRRRVRVYVASMAVRTACFVGAIFTPGVLRWILIAGAVVLPYFAVVIANQLARRR